MDGAGGAGPTSVMFVSFSTRGWCGSGGGGERMVEGKLQDRGLEIWTTCATIPVSVRGMSVFVLPRGLGAG